jgi:PHD/YefM family antitoxin component YafN of YafNO toxin-antitoxin module
MSVLRSIESKLESLFEGAFGRAFRTNVQPVELARKLAKEMDDHRNVLVSRVHVPNAYTIYLSTKDRAQFADYESDLLKELADHLKEHARREDYAVQTPLVVKLETDDDLGLGVFGIATQVVQPPPSAATEPAAREPAPSATMIYRPEPVPVPPGENEAEPQGAAYLAWEGQKHELDKPRTVIGRSRECDIQLSDSNASRKHAEIRRDGAKWWLVDLESTNGVEVNGKRVQRLDLEDGTSFMIGSTELVFSREPG